MNMGNPSHVSDEESDSNKALPGDGTSSMWVGYLNVEQ
jgi:hypothetical protein